MARRGGGGDEGMPATGAGLLRYFDEDSHGPKIEPRSVVVFCVGVIVVEILFHAGIL